MCSDDGTVCSGSRLSRSMSVTAPDDWTIEHIAEDRSPCLRYSLGDGDGVLSLDWVTNAGKREVPSPCPRFLFEQASGEIENEFVDFTSDREINCEGSSSLVGELCRSASFMTDTTTSKNLSSNSTELDAKYHF